MTDDSVDAGREAATGTDARDDTGRVRPDVGQVLAEARGARGLSQEDAARALNLRVQVIQAIEADAFDELPGTAFMRGYIRAYGRLLNMDEEYLKGVLDRVPAATETVPLLLSPAALPVRRSLGQALHGHAGLVLTLLTLLVALVVAAGLLLVWPQDSRIGLEQETVPAVPPATEAPAVAVASRAPPPVEPTLEDTPAEPAPATLAIELTGEAEQPPANETVMEPAAEPSVASAPPPAAPGSSRVERQADADGNRIRILAGGSDHLRLRFSGDCWVEVRDVDDRGVYSDLNRTGQQLDLFGRGPFRVLLGYAPAVELDYNGEPVALAPHIRNDVASLVVGR